MNIYKFFFITWDKICVFLRKFIFLFVSPKDCILCSAKTQDADLCEHCKETLKEIIPIQQRCQKCGRVLISEINLCMDCRQPDKIILQNIQSVFPLYEYQLSKKELLYRWKIKEARSLSKIFADNIAYVLNNYYKDIPIVPIPPRPDKIKRKGWDQIQELTKYLKYYHNIKVYDILQRNDNQQQKKLNRQERLEHIKSAYKIKDNIKNLPKEVILLDDIITTGSTLESCAKILKNNGIQDVKAVTLFIV